MGQKQRAGESQDITPNGGSAMVTLEERRERSPFCPLIFTQMRSPVSVEHPHTQVRCQVFHAQYLVSFPRNLEGGPGITSSTDERTGSEIRFPWATIYYVVKPELKPRSPR